MNPRYCIYCIHCQYDRWVPYHPEFKCAEGGEMDIWTTETKRCPKEAHPRQPPESPVPVTA